MSQSNNPTLPTSRRLVRGLMPALIASLALGASTAQASTSHKYSSAIQSTTLGSGNGYPAPGGTAVLLGTWKTPQFGDGVVIDHVVIVGQSAPDTIEFWGSEVGYLAHGTVKSAVKGTAIVLPDGSQRISVTGRYTGGTGAYRGAKGTYRYSGTTAPGGSVVSGRSTGSIAY